MISQARSRSHGVTTRERLRHLGDTRACPCHVCAERRQDDPMAGDARPLTAWQLEQRRLHDAEMTRELALWHALVWAPEAAAEAAQFRPDDRAAVSAWSMLRALLEALGILRPQRDHAPLRIADLAVPCHPSTGPPAAWPCTGGAHVSLP